jgi:hypothetical protein
MTRLDVTSRVPGDTVVVAGIILDIVACTDGSARVLSWDESASRSTLATLDSALEVRHSVTVDRRIFHLSGVPDCTRFLVDWATVGKNDRHISETAADLVPISSSRTDAGMWPGFGQGQECVVFDGTSGQPLDCALR